VRTARFTSIEALQEPPKTWADLVGQRFGRLIALGYTGVVTRHGQKQITCQCDCGAYVHVAPTSLRSGATTSCGCRHSDIVRTFNQANAKHGDARDGAVTPEYRAWRAMIARCHDPNHAAFELYGARGVTVCDEWRSDFTRFLADVGRRPSRRHSIDRWPNNEGNYEPGNVRWASPEEQARNQRTTRRYQFRGTWLTLGEIAERTGVPRERIYQRISKWKWTIEEAVSTPVSRSVDEHDLYGRWQQMIIRCTDPRHERYADYGGRGIRVCDRWRESFENFRNDVGLPPSPDAYLLDRIDNNGHYEPGNVRWATPTAQNRNRRSTKLYELHGEKRPLADWAERAGVDYVTVKRRLKYGWSLVEALGTPKGFGRCPVGVRRAWTPEPATSRWPTLTEPERQKLIEEIAESLALSGFPWDDVRSRREKDVVAKVQRGEVRAENDEICRVSQAGQVTCLAAHAHRLEARYQGQLSVAEAFADAKALRRAIQFQLSHGDPVTPRRIVRALTALHRSPLNFPPVLARWLVDVYAPDGGSVFDPCSGFGGRLLGALASVRNVRYIGRDIEQRNVDGNWALARMLGAADRVDQQRGALEDDAAWPCADLVLTSPPYYDREDYGAAASASLTRYSCYSEWSEKFLRRLVDRSLAVSPIVILNVAAIRNNREVYDLPSDVERYAREVGARVERVLTWWIAAFGKNRRHEKILVIRRIASSSIPTTS
jgi:hypothetical protein